MLISPTCTILVMLLCFVYVRGYCTLCRTLSGLSLLMVLSRLRKWFNPHNYLKLFNARCWSAYVQSHLWYITIEHLYHIFVNYKTLFGCNYLCGWCGFTCLFYCRGLDFVGRYINLCVPYELFWCGPRLSYLQILEQHGFWNSHAKEIRHF